MKIYKKHLKLYLSEKKTTENGLTGETELMRLLKNANKELDKVYNGKLQFDISDNENVSDSIDKIKISPKKKRRIKELWLKFDSDLSKIQRHYENFLQNSLQNDSDEL